MPIPQPAAAQVRSLRFSGSRSRGPPCSVTHSDGETAFACHHCWAKVSSHLFPAGSPPYCDERKLREKDDKRNGLFATSFWLANRARRTHRLSSLAWVVPCRAATFQFER